MPIKGKVFFGVDLAGRVDNTTGVAAINEQRELVFVNQVKPDVAIRNYIDFHKPVIIGVDAPLSIPNGRYGTYASRKCDRDLGSLGIPTFATSMLAQLTFRAMTLRRQLGKYEIIEVYPHAAKLRLGMMIRQKKTEEAARETVQNRLGRFVKNVPRASKILFSDHELDAILSAYTAMLYAGKLTDGIGDRDEGLIHIPASDFQKRFKD